MKKKKGRSVFAILFVINLTGEKRIMRGRTIETKVKMNSCFFI